MITISVLQVKNNAHRKFYSAISLNLRLEISFFRGASEGPKRSRVKFSRPDKNSRNP